MAVTGPLIGSSAKGTTGESWMSQAGAKLRLGTPFWMSQMIGRNIWNASIKISGKTSGGNVKGAWKGKYDAVWVGNFDGRGEISGIIDTPFELRAFGLADPTKEPGRNYAVSLRGSGNFDVNWRVDISDGSVFYFLNTGFEFQGNRHYECTDNNTLWSWLNKNDGNTFQMSFSEY